MKKKNLFLLGTGFLIGVVNGLLGAGGGMLAVPVLNKSGMSKKEAHANAVAVIFPLSVISAATYLLRGEVKINEALPFIPAGVIGAVLATLILKKISPKALKIIFGGFMLWAGVRMLIK